MSTTEALPAKQTVKCPSCRNPIIYSDKKGIENGKVVYPKLEPDGKTLHTCPKKPTSGGFIPRAPRKPTFWTGLSIETAWGMKRTYAMSMENYQGEVNPQDAFDKVEAEILNKIKRDSGNVTTKQGEPQKK